MSSAGRRRVGKRGPFLYIIQAVFPLTVPFSGALQCALQGGFCNGVVSGDVAKPGELLTLLI